MGASCSRTLHTGPFKVRDADGVPIFRKLSSQEHASNTTRIFRTRFRRSFDRFQAAHGFSLECCCTSPPGLLFAGKW